MKLRRGRKKFERILRGEEHRCRMEVTELMKLPHGKHQQLFWVKESFGIRLRKTVFGNGIHRTVSVFGRGLPFVIKAKRQLPKPGAAALGRWPLAAGLEGVLPLCFGIRLGYTVSRNGIHRTVSVFGQWLRKMLEWIRKHKTRLLHSVFRNRIPKEEYRSRIQEYGSGIPEDRIQPMRFRWDLLLLIGLVVLAAFDTALASRLEAAARNAQTSVISIAQITSTIGIALGGALMSVGWSQAGRQVLGGGVVGAFASFGGPALIDFVRSVF